MELQTVLICDDNKIIHTGISAYLNPNEFNVIFSYDGETALEIIRSQKVDLIVLDVMLPKMNGFDVCREIRKFSDVYIIMLSARGEDMDRVLGLELGADDYLTKPISPREISIRIKKALKRFEKKPERRKFTLAELTVYPDSYQALVGTEEIKLTTKEFEILSLLISYKENVLTRERILNAVWNYDYLVDTRVVDGMIRRLRSKLMKEGVHFLIRSVYGIGYKIVEVPNEETNK